MYLSGGDIGNGRGYAYVEARGKGERFVPFSHFCSKPKSAPKNSLN